MKVYSVFSIVTDHHIRTMTSKRFILFVPIAPFGTFWVSPPATILCALSLSTTPTKDLQIIAAMTFSWLRWSLHSLAADKMRKHRVQRILH